MKFSAVLLALFAGAVMAAPVPDNTIHERGSPLPSTPIKERGSKLKKPIAERGEAAYEGPIIERGVPLPPGLDLTNSGLGFGEGHE